MALSGSSQMLVHGNGVPWISRSWLWQFILGDASTRVRRPLVVDRGLVSRAIAYVSNDTIKTCGRAQRDDR